MAKHLMRMAIDKVSLVDSGANQKRFAVLKRDDSGDATDVTEEVPEDEVGTTSEGDSRMGLIGKVAEAMGLAKADTFGDMMARAHASEVADESFRTMESAFWTAQYANHEDGTPFTTEQKVTLVKTSLDQFGSYLLDSMVVSKAGRKISGKRLEGLKGAFRILGEIIEQQEAGFFSAEDEPVTKEIDMDEKEMTTLIDERVSKAVAAAMAPDGEVVTALTKALTEAVKPVEPVVEKADEKPEPKPVEKVETVEQEDAITNAQLAEAVVKLAERMDASEASERQSQAGSDEPIKKKASPLAGIL